MDGGLAGELGVDTSSLAYCGGGCWLCRMRPTREWCVLSLQDVSDSHERQNDLPG